jgi:hypothetical protein
VNHPPSSSLLARVWHLHPHMSLLLDQELHAALGGIYETKEVARLSQSRSGEVAYRLAARNHWRVSRDALAGALASVEDPEVSHLVKVGSTSVTLRRERRCGDQTAPAASLTGITASSQGLVSRSRASRRR